MNRKIGIKLRIIQITLCANYLLEHTLLSNDILDAFDFRFVRFIEEMGAQRMGAKCSSNWICCFLAQSEHKYSNRFVKIETDQ